MLGISSTTFNLSMLRRFSVWYSVKDGNWSDPAVWMSNGKKKHKLPQPGDDVNISHTVTCDLSPSIRNLYVAGTLKFDAAARTLTITGDLQATGTVDQSAGGNTIVLRGVNNVVSNYFGGTNGTVSYNGSFDQYILPVTYCNLTTGLGSKKYLIANTILTGKLSVGNLECGIYDLTVGGATTIPNENLGNFSKSGSGKLLFIGQFSNGENSTIDWSSGNPDVEFRGGLIFNSYKFNTGTGTFTFTTNNQGIRAGANNSGTWNANILIKGAITLTNINGSNLNSFGVIDGDNMLSTLKNQGHITLYTTTIPMNTGIFDYMNTNTSSISYSITGDYTLPYTIYANLGIGGNAIVYLSGNTTVNNLSVSHGFECGIYDLVVNGTTTLNNGVDGFAFKKSGPGNLLFVGAFSTGNCAIDLTGGNPDLEFRGGFSANAYFINSGTGNWKFSTNNQSINISANNTGTFKAPILISGPITVTNISNSGYLFATQGTINGDNVGSTFVNAGKLQYNGNQPPMQTGVLDCNFAENTFYYSLLGNQDITPGTYRNLYLSGSGVKKLLGNVSVSNSYILSAPATLNPNGFSLTNP